MVTVDTLMKFLQNYQRSNIFHTIAGVSGALAIALGAYGSHAKTLNLPENEQFKTMFETANRYHLIQNVVFLAVPSLKRPNLAGSFLLSGQLLFCGGLYVAALTRNTIFSKPVPYGGFLLIAAWLSVAF